jgi:hypothetical protein
MCKAEGYSIGAEYANQNKSYIRETIKYSVFPRQAAVSNQSISHDIYAIRPRADEEHKFVRQARLISAACGDD